MKFLIPTSITRFPEDAMIEVAEADRVAEPDVAWTVRLGPETMVAVKVPTAVPFVHGTVPSDRTVAWPAARQQANAVSKEHRSFFI
jgi:hypothetical protein